MKLTLVLDEWDSVVEKLRAVLVSKLVQYGTTRYDDHSKQFNFWMCFSDVHRKTLRLEKLTANAVVGGKEEFEKLIDDYKDIANYAIMAVQILEKYDGIRTDSDS